MILASAPAGAGTYCDRPRVFTRLVRGRERSRFLAPVRIGFPQNFNSLRGAAQMTRERYRNRVNTIEEVTATDFYMAEAEAWKEQAKNP